MAIEKELAKYKKIVEKELQSYFDIKIFESAKYSPFATTVVENLAEFTMRGGKRLRPALIYFTYKLFDGSKRSEATTLSIFIELIQSYLLIHDDIIDRADLRRGGVTVHKAFEKYSKDNDFNDDIHFGTSIGIVEGDLASEFAREIISQSNFPKEVKDQVNEAVCLQVAEVIYGQIQDIVLTYPIPYTKEDILKVHRYKTATYTFQLPMKIGAILAQTSQRNMRIIDDYAIACGIAFQIRDDILGVFGKEDITGKPAKSDLIENKKTLLIYYAYENANRSQKEILNKYLGKKDLTGSQAEEIRKIIIDTGSLKISEDLCKQYAIDAKNSINLLEKVNSKNKNLLIELTEYLLKREY